MSGRLAKVVHFAAVKHRDQVRKYSGESYINHPIEVAKIVAEVSCTEEMICAAYLHDVIEDTDTDYDEIVREFGVTIADHVNGLTDVSTKEDGNRAARKKLDRDHLSKQDADVQTIKLADLISNTVDIVENDPKFAKVYLVEARELYKVLDKGSVYLRQRLLCILNDSEVVE